MKRKMMAVVTASLMMMALWSASAYAEQESMPTEATKVEVSDQKVEAENKTPAPEVETPGQDETEKSTPAPKAETPGQDETQTETPVPEAETPGQDETQIETPSPEVETKNQDETQIETTPELETPAPELETSAPQVETPDQAEAFEGSVSVSILGKDKIAYGDRVTLLATIDGAADIMYSLRWEVNDGNGWQTVEGECESKYSFTLTEQNAGYQWRVMVLYTPLVTLEPLDVPLGLDLLGQGIPWVFGLVASIVCECFE